MTDSELLRRLLDREEIRDVLYRYAAAIDVKDYARLRTVFTDDVVAQYAGAPEIHGADELTSWIREMSPTTKYQHHLLNVYEVEVDGDDGLGVHVPHVAPGRRGDAGQSCTSSSPATATSPAARRRDVADRRQAHGGRLDGAP